MFQKGEEPRVRFARDVGDDDDDDDDDDEEEEDEGTKKLEITQSLERYITQFYYYTSVL